MNHIFSLIWNATTQMWVAVAETARSRSKPGRSRRVASAAAVVLGGFGALAFSPVSLAAGSGLQLCDPAMGPTLPSGIGSGSSAGSAGGFHALTCSVTDLAFTLNNAGSDTGASGYTASTARISGYADGTLELKGTSGISMLNVVEMNGNKITQLAPGTLAAGSQDAVNGSQLFATNQNVAGNTTAISNLDGRVTSNTSSITAIDGRVTKNAGDIVNLTNSLNNGTQGLVRQDAGTRKITVAKDLDGTLVDMTGTAGARTVGGVKAGALNASSLEAVNGSQLYATNQTVSGNSTAIGSLQGLVSSQGSTITAIDGRVTKNAGDIVNLTNSLNNGTQGLVRQDAVSRNITVAKNLDGTLVDMTGTAGARTLTGVKAGAVNA
ncbi:hemagluttinin domain protein, partial [Achromobacter arsenitoxydans SY8]